jgi:hypothetical protein
MKRITVLVFGMSIVAIGLASAAPVSEAVNAKAATKYAAIMIAASHHVTDSVRLAIYEKGDFQ